MNEGEVLCSKCGQQGPAYRKTASRSGLSSQCKSCQKEYEARRLQSPEGKAARAWFSLRKRAGNRSGRHPTYAHIEVRCTKAEFMEWAVPVYVRWSRDRPEVAPMLDREDPKGHYEVGNLRLVDRVTSNRNRCSVKNISPPDGMSWCGGVCKAYLPTESFFRDKSRVNGLGSKCKRCHMVDRQQRRRRRKSDEG